VPHQSVELYGDRGRIEVEVPFTPPPASRSRILVDDGRSFAAESAERIEIDAVNQYTVQGDEFSAAIRGVGAVPCPIDDAIANMRVIDALFRSADTGRLEPITVDASVR
jgi:predicted dehydrogenase